MLLPLAAITLVLTGCGGSDPEKAADPPPSTASVEPDQVCPAKLARSDDPEENGFGTQEDATERPSLPSPQQAWTCQYDAVDAAQTADGGTEWAWVLHGTATEVTEAELPALTDALAQVVPFPDGDRMCTDDLGPRWLVVYPGSEGLVGVVVDDYGCREVRLTDDPASTPPGEAERDGTVPGVLDGGSEVLTALGLGRTE